MVMLMLTAWDGVKVIKDIELSFIHPPISDRNFDWQATRKGYDEGDLMGRGPTPEAALADLLEQENSVHET